jgi:hypothetical protein
MVGTYIADHECKYLILLKVQGLLVIKEVFSIVVLFTTYNSKFKYVTYENVGDFLDEKREF